MFFFGTDELRQDSRFLISTHIYEKKHALIHSLISSSRKRKGEIHCAMHQNQRKETNIQIFHSHFEIRLTIC